MLTKFASLLYLCFSFKFSVNNGVKIFRSDCRRDALFKVTDRNSILTGSEHLITSYQKSTKNCVRECLRNAVCRSINYKQPASVNDENCQLLDIDKSNQSASVNTTYLGWKHYEPVELVTPRCRLSPCSTGYECSETCTHPGYKCTEVNHCLSNPCVHGTCSSSLSGYSCSCTSPYSGTRCDQVSSVCGAVTLSGASGTVTSPNYPSYYGNSKQCSWTITVTSGRQIRLTMEYFNTESCCDYLHIRNGGSSSSTLIVTLKGTPALSSYTSSSNKMYLYFRTDGSVTRKGFKATWSMI